MSVYLGVLPPRRGECGPVALVRRGWLDNHRVWMPAISADAFDCSGYCAFHARAFVDSRVIYCLPRLLRKLALMLWHDAGLSYVIHNLFQNSYLRSNPSLTLNQCVIFG